MGPHMEVSLHVDDRRDVVSITFAKPAPSGDRPRPPLQAVRMEQLSPNLVVKYNSAGILVGIDLFEAASVLGLKDAQRGGGPSISFRVGHVPGPGRPPPPPEKSGAHVPAGGTGPTEPPAKSPDPAGAATHPGSPESPVSAAPPGHAEPPGPMESPGKADAGVYGRPAEASRPGGGAAPDAGAVSPLAAASRKMVIRPRSAGPERGRIPWISRLRALLTGRRACPHCGLLFHRKHLKFKRFLNRDEAEALEKKVRLKSHFVYGCPRCRGDLLDV